MSLHFNNTISLILLSFLAMPHFAKADIYMQQNVENEILLTNLAPESVANPNNANNDSHDGSQPYILLVADDVITEQTITNTQTANHFANKKYADIVASVAKQTAVEPALLHAVIRVESNYNPNARSIQGARGLMQLMPATAKRFNVHNVDDPKQNVLGGAQYLRELQKLYKGNIQLVLAAYNAGPSAVTKYGSNIPPYTETRLYVPKVLGLYRQFRSETIH